MTSRTLQITQATTISLIKTSTFLLANTIISQMLKSSSRDTSEKLGRQINYIKNRIAK